MGIFGVKCKDSGVLRRIFGTTLHDFGVPRLEFWGSMGGFFEVTFADFWGSRVEFLGFQREFGGILGFWGAHQVLEDEREAALRVNDVVQCHDVGVLQVLQQRHCGGKVVKTLVKRALVGPPW